MGRGQNNVVHGMAGNGSRYERAHEHAGDRGIPVRKMEDVGLRLLSIPVLVPRQIHSSKPGIPDVIVVASFEAGERGNGVDAHRPQVVRTRLKEWKNVG